MSKILFFILVLISSLKSFCQETFTIEDFKADFKNALKKDFTIDELNKMFKDYDTYLTPHSDVTVLYNKLQGKDVLIYPLSNFRNDSLYFNNINYLLDSKNPNHRILAYLVIASSYDTSKQNILLSKIKTETDKGCLIWSGMALLYFQCDHTTDLFDFLVENEDFGDAHMLPMYILLNKDSLRETAYNRINSKNKKARILAVQSLAYTQLDSTTERVLKQTVLSWPIEMKGYAIFSFKQLQVGDQLPVLLSSLNDKRTEVISIQSLCNSPTNSDQIFARNWISNQDTLSSGILDGLFYSKNNENVKYWLKILYTKPIPKDYDVLFFNQPILKSDSVLLDLQIAIQKTTDKMIFNSLIRSLESRTDTTSISIMLELLKSKNRTVRYWTAETLKNNPSVQLKTEYIQNKIKKTLAED